MEKILGIDLGTNSIGLSVRNLELGETLPEQLEYYCSDIFSSGVGKNDKGKEYSYAAQRTKFRGQRHLHRTRRYRLWRTLEVLIEAGYCPLSMDDLDKWRIYNKSKGLHREYPIHSSRFEQWIRLDFDGDGLPDYSSPFQLREEIATQQLDLSEETNRYKIGRGLYHIAQHRGFKSSKGETLQTQETEDKGDTDTLEALKKSEQEKSKSLKEYMDEYGCRTAGCAFAKMEREGIRIRANSEYQVIRSMHEEEIRYIFEFQKQLDSQSDFFHQLISRAKGEGSIFYKKPLRSQRGNVGKCTLEPTKSRCPISRPEFEIFRTWSALNNLKYKAERDEWVQLPLQVREMLFNELFLLSRNSVTIDDIRKKIQQKTTIPNIELNYSAKTKFKTCPVVRRLKNLLGEQWQTAKIDGYNYEDLWHICYEADELTDVQDFATKHLHADKDTQTKLERLWGDVGQGYAMLSLKAINHINYFLLKGYIYSDAVLLAKLPEVFGEERWHECEASLLNDYESIKQSHKTRHTIYKITNNLIAAYKAKNTEDTFAYKDYSYTLDASDKKDVRTYCIDTISKAGWNELPHEEQEYILAEVERAYQAFFHDSNREYLKVPTLTDSIREYVNDNYGALLDERAQKKLRYLYHPSSISIYQPAKPQNVKVGKHILSKRLLGSPDVGVFKNPVAMRTLHVLRKHINELIINGIIDEDYTRVVVELARDMNDANMRKAIELYQNKRQEENSKIAKILADYFPNRSVTQDDVYKARLMFEQQEQSTDVVADSKKDSKLSYNDAKFQKLVIKYALLKEQNFQCLYTGKTINIANLFNDNKFQFEHTIPRSISFDDSLANQTICDTSYNTNVKGNKIPSQLAEYDQILLRIQPWIDKVEMLKDRVRFWKDAAKFATTKEAKDDRIQQMHAWRMELEYWEKKVGYFLIDVEKLNLGFRNRQLVDTRIISKYAYHFLKSVFKNVDVQRGETTAIFRKVLGVQSMEEKKDRSKHSHHAIDATMLTLIPSDNRRDAMIKLFYDLQEAKDCKNGLSVENITRQLQAEVASCNIKGVNKVVPFIEENILINHISRDKALVPARRKERLHGKVVTYTDENGETKPKVINMGDCIRGSLHQQSWYGAIKYPIIDDNGKPIRNENKEFVYDEKKSIRYVKRFTLDELVNNPQKKMNWDSLEKAIVDKHLYAMMRSQYPELSLKDAVKEGLYMLDKKGNRVNKIRHIRCFAPSNIHVVPIKAQTYKSAKPYKQDFLADVGDVYAMACYQDEKGKRLYKVYSLYIISKTGLMSIPEQIEEKGKLYHLVFTLKKDMKLLLFEHHEDEVISLPNAQISKYLYVIQGFESDGRITMVNHLYVNSELSDSESIKSFSNLPKKIRCSATKVNFLVEGVDFKLTTRGIQPI